MPPRSASILWQHLEAFPPIKVRLLARIPGPRYHHHALTNAELAITADIPLARILEIALLFSWDTVTFAEMRRFCAACRFDPTLARDRHRVCDYEAKCLQRHARPFQWIQRSPVYQTEFLPLIRRLSLAAAADSPTPACRLIQGISPGLLTQEDFIARMQRDRKVRQAADNLSAIRAKPDSLRRSQRLGWARVRACQRHFLLAARRLDEALKTANEASGQTWQWEKSRGRLIQRFLRTVEHARCRVMAKEMALVRKIRKKLMLNLKDHAKRVPVRRSAKLRQPWPKPRSTSPSPNGSGSVPSR